MWIVSGPMVNCWKTGSGLGRLSGEMIGDLSGGGTDGSREREHDEF